MHEQLPQQPERKRRKAPRAEPPPSEALELRPPAQIERPDPREELAALNRRRAELKEELNILNTAIRMRRPNLASLDFRKTISLKGAPNTALSHREYENIWDAKQSVEEELKRVEGQAGILELEAYTPDEIAELRDIEAALAPDEVPEELARFATKEAGTRKEYPAENIALNAAEKAASVAPVRWYANYFKLWYARIPLAISKAVGSFAKKTYGLLPPETRRRLEETLENPRGRKRLPPHEPENEDRA